MTTAITIISWTFQIYEFLILIRVLLSWLPGLPGRTGNINPNRPAIDHPLIRILNQITEPVLAPLRRLIPPIGGAIDISPVIALILLEILRTVLVRLLLGLVP
jgi:YggT family protein